jgi:hypothetical protein
MELKEFIDNRNVNLWKYLNSIHSIEVEFGDYDNYEVFSKNKTSIIYIPKNKIDIPSFTHELLHILLWTKGIYIGNGLMLSVREKPFLQNILTESLIEHIGNCLSHIKMLPVFKEMGFSENEFISDYNVNKLDDEFINDLNKHFYKERPNGGYCFNETYVEYYIGKYFSAKSCPNSNYNYSKALENMKRINTQLYDILDDFVNKWVGFDIDNIDVLTGGYRLIEYNFEIKIENWIANNRIK